MPRRTPVKEIQSEEIPGSPLRRSSRISNASPVPTSAPTKVLSRRNSATEVSSVSTPTRVTRSRRSSFSLDQEKNEEVDKKVTKTPRTRRASFSQNDENDDTETTTKRKTRGSSVPKEPTTEVKKPATRRRKSVSEDEEKSDENETAKRSTRSRSGSITKKTDLEDLKPKSNSETNEKLDSPVKKAPESARTLEAIEEDNKEGDSPQTNKIPIVRMKRLEVTKVDLDLSIINETSLTEEDSTTQEEGINSTSQHKEETEDVENISKEKETETAIASKKDEKTEDVESSKFENTKSNEDKLDIVEKSSVIKENPSAVKKDAEISDASLSETSFHLQLSSSINETSFTHENKENSPSNKENVSPQKRAAVVETECEPMEVDVSPSPVKSHRKSLTKSLKTDDVGKELEIAAKVTDEIANFLTEEIKFTGKNYTVTSKLHESLEDNNSTGENRKHYRLSLKKNKESVSPKVNGTSEEDKGIKTVTEKNEETSKEMSKVSSVKSPTVSEDKDEKVLSQKTDSELESAKEPEKEDNDIDTKPSEKRESFENKSQKESPRKSVSQESTRLSQVMLKENEDLTNEESESSSAVEVEYASPIEEPGDDDSDIEPLQVEETEETEKEVENSSSKVLTNDSTVNESPEKHESPQIENEEISEEIQTSSPTKSLNQSMVEECPEGKNDSLKEQVPEDEGTKEEQMKGIKEIHELSVTKEPNITVQESKSSPEKTTIEATIRESEETLIESSSPTKSLNESNAGESSKDKQITEEQVKETVEVQESSLAESQEKIKIEEKVMQPEKEASTAEDKEVEELTNNTEKEDMEAISAVETNDVEDEVSTQETASTMDDDDEEEETSVLYNTSGTDQVVEDSQTDEEGTLEKKITDSKTSQIEDKSTPEILILSENEEDNRDVKGKTPEKEDKAITSNQRRSSFTMQENLKADDGKNLREKIHKVVDMFCAGIKNKDVKLNVSLEYTGQISDDSENGNSKTDMFEVSLAAVAVEDQQEERAPKNEKGSKRRKICHEEERQQLLDEDSPSKDTTENEEISLSESKKKKKKRKAVSIESEDVSSPKIEDISPSKKQKKLPNTPYKTPKNKEKAPTSGEESEEDVNISEKNHEQVVPKSGRRQKKKSNSIEETDSPCHFDFENLPSYMQTADESKELDVTWAPSEDEDTESSDSSTKDLYESIELQEDLEKLNEDVDEECSEEDLEEVNKDLDEECSEEDLEEVNKNLDEECSDTENKTKKQKSKSSASVKLSFSGGDTSGCVFEEENEDEKSKQKGKKKRKLFHLSDYDISKAMKMDLETSTEETKEEQKSIKKRKNKVTKQTSVEENDLPQTSKHVKDNDKNVKKRKKKSRKVQNISSSTSEDEDVADVQEFGPDVLFSRKLPKDVEVDTDYFKPSSVRSRNKQAKSSKIKPSVTAGTSEWDVQMIS